MTVITDVIVKVFNRSGTTRTVALDLIKLLDKVWHGDLYSREFLVTFSVIFLHFSVTLLRLVLNEKSLQEFPINAGVCEGSSILGLALFLLTFLMVLSVILLSVLLILIS